MKTSKLIIPSVSMKTFSKQKRVKETMQNKIQRVLSCVKKDQQMYRNASMDVYVITVKLMSNCGDPNYIRLSQIDILDNMNSKIPVIRIDVEPDLQHSSNDLLIKSQENKEESELWMCQWKGTPVSLKLTVLSMNALSVVRIWNGSEEQPQNTSKIDLFIGDKWISDMSLGIAGTIKIGDANLPRQHKRASLDVLEKKKLPACFSGLYVEDKFGFVPCYPSNVVMIDLMFRPHDGNVFGLNQIEFYNSKGELMKLEKDIRGISYEGCEILQPLQNMFKKNKVTRNPDDMWTALRARDEVTLVFTFNQNVSISVLRIYNHNAFTNYDYCPTPRARVRANDNIIWCGTLRHSMVGLDEISSTSTKIWFQDIPEL